MATFHRGYATVLDGALRDPAQVNAARAAATRESYSRESNG
jgi:dihydroorotase